MNSHRTWLIVSTFATLILAPPLAHAAWLVDGNPVCTASGQQAVASVLADGAGGVYVVWLDARRGLGGSDLYASRIDADGSRHAGWPADGLALTQTNSSLLPQSIVTSSGDLIVFTWDSGLFKARMQRATGAGAIAAGFPANGVVLPMFVGGYTGTQLFAVTDGAQGAFLMWNTAESFGNDVAYLTHISATGAVDPVWPVPGLQVAQGFQQLGGWSSLHLSADRLGGVWVTESHVEDPGPIPNFNVGSQEHIRPDRTRSAVGLSPDGYTNNGPYQSYLYTTQHTPDGTGGAFATWRVGGPLGPLLYMRHHLADGTPTGAAVAAPVDLQLLDDGTGGMYLLGVPLSAAQLELHRRNATLGAPSGWASGVVLTTAASYLAISAVRSGSNVYVGWSNGASGSEDLRASAVTSAGALSSGWVPEGTIVSSASGTQNLQAMAAGSTGDAYVVWTDSRSGALDLYLSRLGPSGPIHDVVVGVEPGPRSPLALAVDRSTPNPQSTRGARLALTLPTDADATLELLDVTGRVRSRQELSGLAPGRHSIVLAPGTVVPPGLYFLRLTQGGQRALARITLID